MGKRFVPSAFRRSLETLPGLAIMPLDAVFAALAGQLRGRSGLGLADAVVAATATRRRATLLTNARRLDDADTPVPMLLLDSAMEHQT